MKKRLIYFVPITSILVILAIIATYFIEDIFKLMQFTGVNFSTILPNSDFTMLLYLSVIGIVGIPRKRK